MAAKEYNFYTVDNFKKILEIYSNMLESIFWIVNFPNVIGNDVLSLLDLRLFTYKCIKSHEASFCRDLLKSLNP